MLRFPISKFQLITKNVQVPTYVAELSQISFLYETEFIRLIDDVNQTSGIDFRLVDVIPHPDNYDLIDKWIYKGSDLSGQSYFLSILNE